MARPADILMVERLVPEVLEWLRTRYTVDSRSELAADGDALLRAVAPARAVVLPREVFVTREFLECAPHLLALARMHAGSDRTDLEACRERNVRVIQAMTANVRSNAEFLVAGLLLLYRRGMVAALMGQRGGEICVGRELSGSVVGLLGVGATAHTLSNLLQGLGARVLGYDPALHHSAPIWKTLAVQPVALPELMAQCDAVSVQLMYASRYQGFISDKVLQHCRPGQLWVGISRSQLFDPHALAGALTDGRIEACLLDGADPAFTAVGKPLHGLPNLLLTPRLGSHTREARTRASWHVARRIDETLAAAGDGNQRQGSPGFPDLALGTAGGPA